MSNEVMPPSLVNIALENNHTVYILGAGFSAEAGLPVISNFLHRMRDCHESLAATGRASEANAIAEILKFRLFASPSAFWTQLNLENIEELFSLASALQSNIYKDMQVALSATLEYAEKKEIWDSTYASAGTHYINQIGIDKFSWLHKDSKDPGSYFVDGMYSNYLAIMLGMYKNGNVNGKHTFITFNYDTLVERALNNLHVKYFLGLEPNEIDQHASAKSWNIQTDKNADVCVLKIHGSVNWSVAGDKIKLYNSLTDVLGDGNTPLIFPPTWSKQQSVNANPAWGHAIARLATATRIVVLGYSMPDTDPYFQHLIAAGLLLNISLREIIFTNPDKARMRRRAGEWLRQSYINNGQITFCPNGLKDMINKSYFDESKYFSEFWNCVRSICNNEE